MPRTQMPLGDCLRALGLTPEASWDDIRQAYKDLVRVWHPDRFQSDPALRDRAQEQLQKINEAYLTLKSAHRFDAPPPGPPPPPPPPRPSADPAPPPPAATRRRSYSFLWRWPVEGVVKIVGICLMPILFILFLQNFLRVPSLESVLAENNLPRPAILSPSRMIDPLLQPSAASAALTDWAREGASLWRALPGIGRHSSDSAAYPVRTAPETPNEAPPDPARHRTAAALRTPVQPVNGTEIMWTRRSGEGELWITNETDQDALVTLVQTRTTAPLRAIYVQARNKVCIRNIAMGVDDLLAEAGEDWDARQMRFRTARHTLGRSGPFNFFEVSSAQGSAGRRYDAVLRMR